MSGTYVAPQDWTGPPAERPGLMWRRWQVEEYLAAKRLETHGPPAAVFPDRILVFGTITTGTALELCSPVKGALGITKAYPVGQIGDGWTRKITHGFGIRGTDGLITESLALKFHHRERGRRALFYWTRPVPDPRLTHAVIFVAAGLRPDEWWPWLALWAQLPAPTWTSELTTAWTDDMPRKVASAAVKKEIRS